MRLIEDVRASRVRLVRAQDEERRALERNIHDGAQQQLVALSVKLGLAKTMATRDVEQADRLLAQLQAEATDAVENLQALAGGIYPPMLAANGLASALAAEAERGPLPVRVKGDRLPRLPQDVEAAAYFAALEALQNVAKYASASTATVTLRMDGPELVFDVRDDGRGFDTASASSGTGLQGMADRVEAVGGRLAVTSALGAGTTVEGRIPVEATASAAAPDAADRLAVGAHR